MRGAFLCLLLLFGCTRGSSNLSGDGGGSIPLPGANPKPGGLEAGNGSGYNGTERGVKITPQHVCYKAYPDWGIWLRIYTIESRIIYDMGGGIEVLGNPRYDVQIYQDETPNRGNRENPTWEFRVQRNRNGNKYFNDEDFELELGIETSSMNFPIFSDEPITVNCEIDHSGGW